MNIQYQMDNLERLFIAGKIDDKEYDRLIDELLANDKLDDLSGFDG